MFNKATLATLKSIKAAVFFWAELFNASKDKSTTSNINGKTARAQAAAAGTTGVTAQNGQVGNLGLTASQEADLVNFLKILSDGFTAPNPVGN